MKVRKKTIAYILRFIALMLFVVSCLLMGLLYFMDILPTKYFWPLCGIYFLLILFVVLALIKGKSKTKTKVISSLTALCLIIGSVMIISYQIQTNDFLTRISSLDTSTDKYFVVVKKDGPYQQLDKLSGKTIASNKNDFSAIDKALEKLLAEVPVTNKDIPMVQLAENLFENKVDALLLDERMMRLIESDNEDFSQSTKIIHTIAIKKEQTAVNKGVKDVLNEPFIIYISGSDQYGKISDVSLSDVNIVMVVNPLTHTVTLINIPRDSYVPLDGNPKKMDKLTHAGSKGTQGSIVTLNALLDIDINYYIKLNFDAFVGLVDEIGGVTVDSEFAFTGGYYQGTPVRFNKGPNTLDGFKALIYARERKNLPDSSGDEGRGRHQQQLIAAIIKKVTTSPALLLNYSNILKVLESSFATDLTKDDIYALIRNQIDTNPAWTIQSSAVTGESDWRVSYSMPGYGKVSVIIVDEDSLAAAKTTIQAALNAKPDQSE